MPNSPSARGYASGTSNSPLGLLPGVAQIAFIANNGVTTTVTSAAGSTSITIGLGAITPISVNASGTVQGSNLSGTNTGDITIAGQNFLSLSAQVLTANPVNLASGNVTGTLPYTLGGTGLSTLGLANRVLIVNPSATALSYTFALNQNLQQVDNVTFAKITSTSGFTPPSLGNTVSSSNSIYFSVDSNALVYKDAGGVVHLLY